MKGHHITFGRMNPVTRGHEAVVNQVTQHAKKEGAGHTIILTRTQDNKKNPLSPEQKLKHAQRAFPGANIDVASKEAPTMLHHASKLHSQGVQHLTVHVGSDRVSEFKDLLNKYNGIEGKHGAYKFKKISVVPVGGERKETGKDDDVAAASGTAMRKHAAEGNKEAFMKMAPTKMKSEHKEELYHDVRSSMGIKENFIRRFKSWLFEDAPTNMSVGTGVRGLGDVTGQPAGSISNYAAANAADSQNITNGISLFNNYPADTKEQILKGIRSKIAKKAN